MKILNDKRPIVIYSKRLKDTPTLKWYPGVSSPLAQKTSYGETRQRTVDKSGIVTSIDVAIDVINIKRYSAASQINKFDFDKDFLSNKKEKEQEIIKEKYKAEIESGFGQGILDELGITTVYHELLHVTAYQMSNLETGYHYSRVVGPAFNQDWPRSESGNAQLFGETVYKESLKSKISDIESYIKIIEATQLNETNKLCSMLLSIRW